LRIIEEGFAMKRVITFLVLVGFAASLGAQSVAELARKERERRESLKDRRAATVITNDDLLRLKKRPAIDVSSGPPGWDIVVADDPDRGLDQDVIAAPGTAAAAPAAPAGASRRVTPRVAPPGPSLIGDAETTDHTAAPLGSGPLEAQLRAAEELVDLLETKMAALKQEYEFQTGMVPGYVIEEQLTETLQRLQKAQAQAARIRAEYEKRNR
jgi:hypothetical protein